MGLATAADRSAVTLVGPVFGQATGTDYSLIRIDPAGTEVAHLPIALAGNGQAQHSGLVSVDGKAALAVINVNGQPKSGDGRFTLNGLGLFEQCWDGDAADIVFVDLAGLSESRRVRIERFEAKSALVAGDGWILVGDARDTCGLQKHAAAYTARNDGSVVPLWRDASPFDTFGRGIRRTADALEIVGYAQRSIAIQEAAPAANAPDFSKKRSGTRPMSRARPFPSAFPNRAWSSGETSWARASRSCPWAWPRPVGAA